MNFVLHLGGERARYSDEHGKPYIRPRYHFVVTVGDSVILEGYAASPEDEVARMLISRKIAAPSHSLEVRRGDRTVFPPRPIGKWASVVVEESATRTARFRPYRERVTA